AAQTTVTSLAQGTYRFELRVTDNNGAIGRDTMTVTVNAAAPPPNQAPVANAGPDQTITLPTNSITLNGSGTDVDGSIAAYQWTKVAGPAQGSISNATAA
ncbi:PKD domain-containing protein, partial [Umezakia ovalisporum]|uniref:PKD domain-containing protein n=1 Tax=Umezakia ovalisporum TaxID=75695 RepID=UPI0039C633CE